MYAWVRIPPNGTGPNQGGGKRHNQAHADSRSRFLRFSTYRVKLLYCCHDRGHDHQPYLTIQHAVLEKSSLLASGNARAMCRRLLGHGCIRVLIEFTCQRDVELMTARSIEVRVLSILAGHLLAVTGCVLHY